MKEKQKENNINKYLNLGHTEAENHAKTQQEVFKKNTAGTSEVTREIAEFFKTNFIGFAWHYLKSRFGNRHPYQFYPTKGESGVFQLESVKPNSEEITIALLSDWASDTLESDQVGEVVKNNIPDYTIHLGDVYFVGTYFEMEANFTAPYASWYFGESGSLALSGNHEMYSNGNAYFKHLLPAMYVKEAGVRKSQKAGFFCLENEYWRVIGLDTGYNSVEKPFLEIIKPPDCHLRKEQIDWLKNEVKLGDTNDNRGIIILTHHPYISAFREAYQVPGEQLQQIFGDTPKEIIWFWGHDHRLVHYKFGSNGSGPQVYGRCIGHGGLPVETEAPESIIDRQKIDLYDQRIRKKVGRYTIGYNGFVLLKLDNNKATAIYKDLEGADVAVENWQINKENGQLRHELESYLPEMADIVNSRP